MCQCEYGCGIVSGYILFLLFVFGCDCLCVVVVERGPLSEAQVGFELLIPCLSFSESGIHLAATVGFFLIDRVFLF